SVVFQAEDGIRDFHVTGVQTCALPILSSASPMPFGSSNANCRTPRPFPPESLLDWSAALIQEIGAGYCSSSRGLQNPRGVKRALNPYRVRRRNEPLNQRCPAVPTIVIQ